MKKCPFCAEEIQSEAIKCRYCGERLDTKPVADDLEKQVNIQEKLRGQDDSQHEEAPQKKESPRVKPAEEPSPLPSHDAAVKKKSIDWYLEVLKKYAVFSGRARRKEYWMFFLYNLIIGIALGFIDGIAGITPPQIKYSLLAAIYSLIVLIPNIAVGFRRMHDTGRSGWWFLLPIVNFVFLVQDSQMDDNQYGPNPKALTNNRSTDFTSLIIIVVCLSVISLIFIYTSKKSQETPEVQQQQAGLIQRLMGQSESMVKEIRRDGHFIAYDNGTVLDTSTNLMWAAGDNGYDVTWQGAKSYCENYRGGGYTDWRMPMQDELAGLYDTAKSYKTDCGCENYQVGKYTDWIMLPQDELAELLDAAKISRTCFRFSVHLTELIRLTCMAQWASETRGTDAVYVSIGNGKRFWFSQSVVSSSNRALPVRSAK